VDARDHSSIDLNCGELEQTVFVDVVKVSQECEWANPVKLRSIVRLDSLKVGLNAGAFLESTSRDIIVESRKAVTNGKRDFSLVKWTSCGLIGDNGESEVIQRNPQIVDAVCEGVRPVIDARLLIDAYKEFVRNAVIARFVDSAIRFSFGRFSFGPFPDLAVQGFETSVCQFNVDRQLRRPRLGNRVGADMGYDPTSAPWSVKVCYYGTAWTFEQ
jgi:hypothetical protein